MTLCRRSSKSTSRRFVATPAATRRRWRCCDPGRAARHRRWRPRTCAPGSRRGVLRRARRVPGQHRRGERPRGPGRGCPPAGGAGRGHHRPAGADAAASAGGVGRRHRGRVGAAVRRAARLRRPARRLHGGSHRARALRCPVGWSVSAWTRTAPRRTGWPCRPASSTSGVRRRPATSAPRRCCWRSSPARTPPTTGPKASRRSPNGCGATRCGSPRSLRGGGIELVATEFFDTVTAVVPGRAEADRRGRPRARDQPAAGRRRPRRREL